MTVDTTSNNSKPKSNRKTIIALSAIGLFVITIALAFILAFTVSDGTEKFTGKEREIAKDAIGDGSYQGMNASPTLDLPVAFRGKVVKVYKHVTGKRCSIGRSQGSIYLVDIHRVTFFGMTAPGYDAWICSLDE